MTVAATSSMLKWLDSNEPKVFGNFINGEWIGSSSGKTFSIFNSANNSQLLGEFQDSNESDVNMAVEAAYNAFKSWSKIPGPDRGLVLYRFADLIEENLNELSYMLSAEQGKAISESRGEILRAAKEARFCAGEAFRIEGTTFPGERRNVWSSTIRKPLGVIAAIAPWNFPVVTPVRKIAPALAYGCTVVYKPASATPWTSVKLMELFKEAGVPDGVVNLVIGSGSKVGDPLVSHPLVKGISFTGSSNLGMDINEKAARRLVKTQLELGGKNPAIVLDYEDASQVARQIVSAAFACSGQRCTSISRVIVVKDRKEELTEAILQEMRKIKVGPAWEEDVTMGPLVNKAHLQSVQGFLQIGIEEGARLQYGGNILNEDVFSKGAFMEPALVDCVKPSMEIAKEEVFGPVLCIMEVENKEEALAIANDTKYGLAASIFTDRVSSAYALAEEVEAGMIHINHGTASAAHAPFGGVKQSGAGAYSIGTSNIEFYTEMRVVYIEY